MEILQNRYLQLIEQNIKNISKLDENRQKEIFDKISNDIVSSTASIILARLKIDAPKMIKSRNKESDDFVKLNRKKWKRGFDKFEMLLEISYEAGADFHNEFLPIAKKEENLVFEVLTRLYARCLQIGNEILILLKHGYPDGAHARWRTVHEISTIANFIFKHGNDVARKYLEHNIIDSYHGSQEFMKYHKKLKQPPLASKELKNLKQDFNNLKDKYGSNFMKRYGWAAEALRKSNPSIENIESDVGFDKYRPFNRMACHNIHAGAKGILFRIAYDEQNDKVILTGPSDKNFTDPAHGTAISLYLITRAFLNLYPNKDREIIVEILYLLSEEIGDDFYKIQEKNEETD